MANDRKLYLEHAHLANVPLSRRVEISNGRQGAARKPRRHHLLADKVLSLRQEIATKGHFISPYGANRLYSLIVDALIALGENQPHNIGSVFGKFREIANSADTIRNQQTAWDRFAKREARNEKTHRDALARFCANIQVMQRLGGNHPYGLKLAQIGACIDILTDKNNTDLWFVRLRTNIPEGASVTPLNESRQRNYTKTCNSVPSGIIINGGENDLEDDADD